MSIEATRLQSSLNKCHPMRRKLGFPSSRALIGFHDFKYTRLSRRFKCNATVKLRVQTSVSVKQNATVAHVTKMDGNILGNIQISVSHLLYIHYAASVHDQNGTLIERRGRFPVQSWAPGIGQVENDGRVHRLEVHRARRGINERGGSIGHHTVTYLTQTQRYYDWLS